jgi:predicted ribosome quality control (RQC) complex YloA/Tae2 family protein
MYFDVLTLAAVADELQTTILGGRVQRVVLTGELSLGLEIYAGRRRYQLLASADPQRARIHLVQSRLTRGVEQDTPLLLLLRKYVLGGRIVSIEQPPFERIVMLSIVKATRSRNHAASIDTEADDPDQVVVDTDADDDDTIDATDADLRRCELVIEPQERRSNIILVDDDNRILESIKRVTPQMSSRVILPRRVYELPPAQAKHDPTQATAAGIEALTGGTERRLSRALVAAYRGVSPQVAREVIFRSIGRDEARLDEPLPFYTIAAQLREIFSADWAPTLVQSDTDATAYAPYTVSHLPGAVVQPSISVAIESYYAAREQLTGHRQRRDGLVQQLLASRDRLQRRRDQIAAELERAGEFERLRWEGEMIFAFAHTLQPGQTELLVENHRIAIDPQQSVVEQAQARFKAYDKARSALAGLPERLEQTENQLAGLAELTAQLAWSDTFAQIEQIAQEAVELGYIREPATGRVSKRRAGRARPLRVVSSDGLDIFVGRSARENDEVTFRIGQSGDMWLHVRIIHGAHVIIRADVAVPETTLEEAAGLAAYFSQARDEASVDVDICRRSLVRKIPGGPPGLVTYRAERTLRVAPRRPW